MSSRFGRHSRPSVQVSMHSVGHTCRDRAQPGSPTCHTWLAKQRVLCPSTHSMDPTLGSSSSSKARVWDRWLCNQLLVCRHLTRSNSKASRLTMTGSLALHQVKATGSKARGSRGRAKGLVAGAPRSPSEPLRLSHSPCRLTQIRLKVRGYQGHHRGPCLSHSSKDSHRLHGVSSPSTLPPLPQAKARVPQVNFQARPHSRHRVMSKGRAVEFCLVHPHCLSQLGHLLHKGKGRALWSTLSRALQGQAGRRGHMTTCLTAGRAGLVGPEGAASRVTGVLVRMPLALQPQSRVLMTRLQPPASQGAPPSKHTRPHQVRTYPLPHRGTLPQPIPSHAPLPCRRPNKAAPPWHSRPILRPWQRQQTGQDHQISSSSPSRASRRGKDKGQCALMTGASRDVSMEVSQGTPALSRMRALMHLQLQLVMQALQMATGPATGTPRGDEAPRLPGTSQLQPAVAALLLMLPLLKGATPKKGGPLLVYPSQRLKAHHVRPQTAGAQHHPHHRPSPLAQTPSSLTPSRARGKRRRMAGLPGSLTEPSTSLSPDPLLRGRTALQVSKGARVQDAATGGVAAAVMAEEEEGNGVLMLTLALVTTTKMELVTLQPPMKLLKVVQQETGQATEVLAEEEEEEEVGEARAATVGTVVEATARQPLLQRQLAMSLLLRKALHLYQQTMAVAGISSVLLHAA